MDFSIFRDPKLARELLGYIDELVSDKPLNLMEVCGTHTVSIARYGFRSIMPKNLKLLSGPGCPVCVTADEDIDHIITLAQVDNTIITTFGDMLRVPGSHSSLLKEKAQGRDVRVCYSPLESLQIARENPSKEVIFVGVGFETTAPVVGAALLQAADEGLKNFSIYGSHKTMPAALEAIVNDPEVHIDGLILPGHVSTIIGKAPYEFLSSQYHIPGAITGFEPVDVLEGIILLLKMITDDNPQIANAYQRGVKDSGNVAAQALIEQVFEPCDVAWRGLGVIPGSGLAIKDDYAAWDASKRFEVEVEPPRGHKGCRCGDILRGIMAPDCCPLFGKACNPEHPIGPCMVSSEGSCAAYYRYQEHSR